MKSAVVLILAAALPALATDGPILFKQTCAPCHGVKGDANTPAGKSLGAKDLASEPVQKLTDAEIAATITKGKNKMPSFGSRLGADDVKALIAVVRAFKKS
jgi:mono/diheme cytochrome c family protein